VDGVAIVPLPASRVDELRELWLALHHAHSAVAAVPLQPDDELSWRLRRSGYLQWLEAGTAFALGAELGSELAGYALVRLHEGADNTFDLGPRHGELYSLCVTPEQRGQGIGTRLLDEVDRELQRRGIANLAIAVLAGNDDARRLYERRGLVAGEILMFGTYPA
jgi:ribosomal protein S18 acetylase RimI-like enzyme